MEPLPLSSRDFGGDGYPLVVLHGMLGSSRNWTTTAQDLSNHFRLWGLDLRNHGDSPHASSATYAEMAGDVRAWLEANDVTRPVLVGHSLGGKVAMTLATETPQAVRSLVLADIAPRPYSPHFADDIAILRELDLAALNSRADAEAQLEEKIPDFAFRRFLLTNLERDRETKSFRWQCHLDAIAAHLEAWSKNPMRDARDHPLTYDGFVLAIRGGRSHFVRDEDLPAFATHFPHHEVETVPHVGHNVHVEDRNAFVETLLRHKQSLCASTSP